MMEKEMSQVMQMYAFIAYGELTAISQFSNFFFISFGPTNNKIK